MPDLIQRAAADIVNASSLAVLTGAGISVESGIQPFRGKGGVWEEIDPMEYAHIDALRADPEKVWKVLIKDMNEMVRTARPNAGHKGLVRLEELKKSATIITQNIDGLHQRAGSTDVIEFHGTFAWQRCMTCKNRYETHTIDTSQIPPLCACGGMLRPEVIFFGENIPYKALARSRQAATDCDVMLVVGTSAVVEPAASMPVIAKDNGATVIEINPESSPLTGRVSDYIVLETAGKAMNAIVAEVERRLGVAPEDADIAPDV
jgi:NAD-dependent protein deacetylase/lipoamidase